MGYFQPGVRVISDEDFKRIIDAAEINAVTAEDPAGEIAISTGPGHDTLHRQ